MDDSKIIALTPLFIAAISGAIAIISLFSAYPRDGLAVAGMGLSGACGLARPGDK